MTRWGLEHDVQWHRPPEIHDDRQVNVLLSERWTPRELLEAARREDRPVRCLLDEEWDQ